MTVSSVSANIGRNLRRDSEAAKNAPNTLARLALPFVPAIILFAGIYAFGVNVPRSGEWDLIPVVEQLRVGAASWANLFMGGLGPAKVAAAWLASATRFDVRAAMYAGVLLQLLAFVFLWSVLELTLRAWHRNFIVPLAVMTALLVFSPMDDHTWLSGLSALEAGINSLAAAAILWMMARWPKRVLAVVFSLLVSWIGMRVTPSGSMLWMIVFVAVATQSFIGRKVEWERLAARLLGMLLLVGIYLGAFATARHLQLPVVKPFDLLISILAYLGAPLTQVGNPWISVTASVLGIILLIVALSNTWDDAREVRSIFPWLWLCTYGVLVAVTNALSQLVGVNDSVAITGYRTTAFFWIGFVVISSLALHKRFTLPARVPVRLIAAVAVGIIVCVLNYVRIYRDGFIAFRETKNVLAADLLDIYQYQTTSDGVFQSLGVEASRGRDYMELLEQRALGPFTPAMLQKRERLEAAIPIATKIIAGQGYLDGAACDLISGWAWDARQVKLAVPIQIYDGDTLLGTVPAYQFRPDLLNKGIGTGRYGFKFRPHTFLKDGRSHTIHVRMSGMNDEISQSPAQIVCE